MEPVELIKELLKDTMIFGIGFLIVQPEIKQELKHLKEKLKSKLRQVKEQLEFARQEQRKSFLASVMR